MSHWQMAGATVLLLLVVATALGVVDQRHANRKLFVELEALNAVRDEANVEWGRLQLEYSTLGDMSRVETKARVELAMTLPKRVMVLPVRLDSAAAEDARQSGSRQ